MEQKQLVVYNNRVYGVKVSNYGLVNDRLDYATLAGIISPYIYNGIVREATMYDWEMIHGELDEDDEIYSDYIITEYGYEFLKEYTDEVVFYNHKLDMYIWGVTHYGTKWDHVLTRIELVRD